MAAAIKILSGQVLVGQRKDNVPTEGNLLC